MVQGIALAVIVAAFMLIAGCGVLYLFTSRQERRFTTRLRYESGRLQTQTRALEDAESQLKVKNRLYRILFEHTRDMVFIFGIGEKHIPLPFQEVNDYACETLEYEREQLLDMTILGIMQEGGSSLPGYTRTELATLSDDELLNRHEAYTLRPARMLMERVTQEEHITFSQTFVTRSGRTIPVEVNAHHFTLDGKSMVFCTACDVSERKRAEVALRESERRFHDFFAGSPIGVALYDHEQQLLNVNRACLKMFGTPDTEQFKRIDLLNSPLLPDATRTQIARGETVECDVTMDFGEINRQGLYLAARRGKAYLQILVSNLGLDADYSHRGYLVQVQDATKRVRAEDALRHSELQLQQAQKMEALGTLAGGIAHDFNNILTPILGYTEMMLHMADEDDPSRDFLQEIHKASYRARDLVNQILTFSRRGEQDNKPIHVVPIIKEVLKLQRASLPPEIETRCVVRADHDVVTTNPTQFHQVLMNLCTNAAYVMRDEGGLLEVTASEVTVGARPSAEAAALEPGRYLQITVRDTGSGIPDDKLAHIFEPFYTTKPRGEGTGMGLAVVHGIITALHGSITVQSRIDEGTTFTILLPLEAESLDERDDDQQDMPAGRGGILFVDDEPVIAKMASRMLRALGYDTTISCDSTEALGIFRESPDAFDLLITDLDMPAMDGAELAARITALRPDLPILLCTGYADRLANRADVEPWFVGIVKKPIIMRQLADTVASALSRDPPADA